MNTPDGRLLASTDQSEIELERSLILVQGRPQEFFGIAQKNLSTSNWAAAISHFNQIRKEIYPSRMVAALLSSAKSIYETHKREHVSAEGLGKASTLAGEEMLPILW